MLFSTLSGYLETMGGDFNLVAEFPDHPPVRLQMLGPLAKRSAPARRKRAKAKRTKC